MFNTKKKDKIYTNIYIFYSYQGVPESRNAASEEVSTVKVTAQVIRFI